MVINPLREGAELKEILAELGLRVADLTAGFLGGISAIFVAPRTTPRQAVGSVFVGCVAAGYLPGLAKQVTGYDVSGAPASFLIGLTALVVCNGVMKAVSRRFEGQVNDQD